MTEDRKKGAAVVIGAGDALGGAIVRRFARGGLVAVPSRRRRPRPASGFRSMSTAGWASRKFIAGTRLCPPARNRASSPCSALSASASSTDAGAK